MSQKAAVKMESRYVENTNKPTQYSRMGIALQELAGQINTEQSGLYNQRVIIKSGNVTIDNNELDCEFSIPFDDDTEANEAEIVIYNLTNKTINEFKKHEKITVTAGYQNDTGVIFSGYISKVKTAHEEYDKITTIYALDSESRKEKDIESLSFSKGTKASYILKKLVGKVGLSIAVFKTKRDYTYKDKVSVDGGLMENIKKYAQICGVSAYICKSKIYVCPLYDIKSKAFDLAADSGLLSVSEFEEEQTNETYKDKTKGYECKMLLTHQIQTGSTVFINTEDIKACCTVREGTHEYDGNTFTTTIKAIL